jgi:N-acetylglutamate synthase-like GNAT family acetyltransferase
MAGTIRRATAADFDAILAIINDAAEAYRGVIPPDCWHDPYMPYEELAAEIEAGVDFTVYQESGTVIGVMGLQDREDVILVRHAYVRRDRQGTGIGGRLLSQLIGTADRPVLVGTWAAARWAIGFYRRHGFVTVSEAEKVRLLKTYWTVSERQIDNSVVLKGPPDKSRATTTVTEVGG